MQFTIWGARGSTPVSGPQYVRYGGDTTCAEIETEGGDTIILDAGTGLRALGNRLVREGKKDLHFLLTHAHWDHVMGFPFFKPLYRKGTTIRFHGCTYAQESIRTFLAQTMRPPFFPVDLNQVAATLHFDEACREEFSVGSLCCESILLNHPNHGYGYRLTEKDRSLAFFPDNELAFEHPKGKRLEEYAAFLEGVSVLVHDAEYTPEEYEAYSRGWGHSIYPDTVRLAAKARTQRLILWHINQDRSDDQADDLLESAREAASKEGGAFACEMAQVGRTLEV